MRRYITLVAVATLVGSALWIAPTASAAGACKKFKPVAPDSPSSTAVDAPKEKVILVSEKATEANPVVVEYSHGPAIADQSLGDATTGDPKTFFIQEDARFFNFQLVAKAKYSSVNARIEWASPSPSDIDLRLFGATGAELDYSAAYNPSYNPATEALLGSEDGNGLEQLLGHVMTRCSGFTIESRPATTPGEPAVALKVWLD